MRVPCDVNDEVAVIEPPVIEEKIAERPERSEEKNPVEEVLLVLNKLVLVAFIVVKLVIVPVIPLSVVSVEEAEVSSEVEAVVAERLVIVVVARLDVPVAVRVPTVRLDDDAFVRLV